MDRDEMESWQHFQLICKPEQSGKTFVMIQQIIADVSEPIQGKRWSISFCVTTTFC